MDLDVSFFFLFFLVVVTLLVSNALLFKPFLRRIEEREAQIDGARATAEALNIQATAVEAEFKGKISAAMVAINDERSERLRAEQKESQATIAKAKAAALAQVQDGLKEIDASSRQAELDLSSRAPEVAEALMTQLLGRRAS